MEVVGTNSQPDPECELRLCRASGTCLLSSDSAQTEGGSISADAGVTYGRLKVTSVKVAWL